MSAVDVFFAYRDAPERRAALRRLPGAIERYRLFGLDELAARGLRIRHNLERDGPPPAWARAVDRALNAVLYKTGGYGGDFAVILPSLAQANRCDVVFSTVDTVGIPLVLLKLIGLLRPPIVYTAVGLPERLVQLRGLRVQRLFRKAFWRSHTVLGYAESEVERLGEWFGPGGPQVVFVPFGVDVDEFRPSSESAADADVVSIGADPRRDFDLLVRIASRRQDLRFRIVASADRANSLGALPANVAVEVDVPLEVVRDRLAGTRVVALPVRDNSYSGATTVLLQALAMAKPVVVSRTEAIATGYGLEDGVNCRLVPPGDEAAFERALDRLLSDEGVARAIGAAARATAVERLSWKLFVERLEGIIAKAGPESRPASAERGGTSRRP